MGGLESDLRSQQLLGVAAEHASTRVPVAAPDQTAGGVREALAGEQYECAEDVAVLDQGRLVGLVQIEVLLAAASGTAVAELMDGDPPVVAPGTDQEVAARRMVERAESSLAVVDSDGRFRGLIPAQRMLEVLLSAHHEDLARLGGYLSGSRRARIAAEERVPSRLAHRLPWLLLGLLGAMASAVVVGAFESQLDAMVVLAFFVPAVVYIADAVGTQTETVLIRGLSVGVPVRAVIGRELITGVLLGTIVGAVFLPFALIGWGEARVAVAVALALLASCSIATLVAMALPWLFQRLGTDPAFGSGPLATVIQDLLSIAVYLGIATAIVT